MTFIELVGPIDKRKRYYQYTAIHEYTCLLNFRAYLTDHQKAALRFIDHVLSKLPFKVGRALPRI
jgi:hypothetical protein